MALPFIDAVCTSLPGAEVRYPFESSPDVRAWCVHKRMFAWCATDQRPITVQLKADPDVIPALIASYPFVLPGYHMNKRHWISVQITSDESRALVQGLLEDAHTLVVRKLPKVLQATLVSD